MSGFSVPEFLDLFKTQLDARGDLAALTPDVRTFTFWPTFDPSVTDAIIVGYDATATVTPAAIGRNRVDEDVTLRCQIRVLRPGAGETQAKAARDRAQTLYAAVDNELRTNHPELAGPDDDVQYARCGSYDLAQFPTEVGDTPIPVRAAVLEFEAIYRARVAAT